MPLKKLSFVFLCFVSSCSSLTSENAAAAACHTRLGLGYLEQGEVEKAYHKLQLAVDAAPTSAESLDAMAYYYEYVGEDEKAQSWHERAVHEVPCGATHNNYGVFLCYRNYPSALKQFQLALEDKNYLAYKVYKNARSCALANHDEATAIFMFDKIRNYSICYK